MNVFCHCLSNTIYINLNTEMDVFVSKKNLVHIAFETPLISFYFFCNLINFVKGYWNEGKYFFKDYKIIYPRLNQRLKWKNDYIFF